MRPYDTLTRMADEDPDALSIGVVLGGTVEVDRYWRPELTRLAKEVVAARGGTNSPLCVNVVYHVEGKLDPNEFQGVRTGRFSRKSMHLMVQAAVPSTPVDDRRRALLVLLHQAVDAAEAYATRRSIAEGLPGIRAILASLPAD